MRLLFTVNPTRIRSYAKIEADFSGVLAPQGGGTLRSTISSQLRSPAKAGYAMKSWAPVLQGREGPKYLAIADAIAADVAAGRLAPGDRLPPQRDLAGRLALDFTTVARGYVEAGKRGLVESVVGRGTFVRRHASVRGDAGPQRSRADFSMNMPPEPDDPELLARMREGFASVARRSRLAPALPGLRRIADGPGRGGELARTPRARPLAGAHIPGARRAWRRWSASSPCSRGRGTPFSARRSPIPGFAPFARNSVCS